MEIYTERLLTVNTQNGYVGYKITNGKDALVIHLESIWEIEIEGQRKSNLSLSEFSNIVKKINFDECELVINIPYLGPNKAYEEFIRNNTKDGILDENAIERFYKVLGCITSGKICSGCEADWVKNEIGIIMALYLNNKLRFEIEDLFRDNSITLETRLMFLATIKNLEPEYKNETKFWGEKISNLFESMKIQSEYFAKQPLMKMFSEDEILSLLKYRLSYKTEVGSNNVHYCAICGSLSDTLTKNNIKMWEYCNKKCTEAQKQYHSTLPFPSLDPIAWTSIITKIPLFKVVTFVKYQQKKYLRDEMETLVLLIAIQYYTEKFEDNIAYNVDDDLLEIVREYEKDDSNINNNTDDLKIKIFYQRYAEMISINNSSGYSIFVPKDLEEYKNMIDLTKKIPSSYKESYTESVFMLNPCGVPVFLITLYYKKNNNIYCVWEALDADYYTTKKEEKMLYEFEEKLNDILSQ